MQITTYKELKHILTEEKHLYFRSTRKQYIYDHVNNSESSYIWRYVKLMRWTNYFSYKKSLSIFYALPYLLVLRAFRKKGIKLGLNMGYEPFDSGLTIYHSGSIIVNTWCKIGKNFRLHGNNCIGNSRSVDDCPTIGDNVRFCAGAMAFGDIYIADNVTVAAGAVVTKSCYEKGAVLAGVPAKIVKIKKDYV